MAVDFATLGLKVDGTQAVATLKEFRGAADQAAQAGTRIEASANRVAGAMRQQEQASRQTSRAMMHDAEQTGTAFEALGKRLEHTGVMAAFAISNLANDSEQGFTGLAHSIAMLGFAFGPLAGTVTTTVAVIMEQLEKMFSAEEKRAKEFGKNLVDAVRKGAAEDLAKQQQITLGDLTEAKAKVTRMQNSFLPNRAELDKARDEVKRLRDEYEQLTKAVGAAAERTELLARMGNLNPAKITTAPVEAYYQKQLAKAFEESTAAILRQTAFITAHENAMIKAAKAADVLKQKQEDIAKAAGTSKAFVELSKRIDHALATGTGVVGRNLNGDLNLASVEGLGAPPGTVLALAGQSDFIIQSYNRESGVYRQLAKGDADYRAQVMLQQAQEEERIRENFLRQFQQTFASGLADLLTKGLNSWRDFFGSVKDMFIKMLADVAASKAMSKLEGIFGGGSVQTGVGADGQPIYGVAQGSKAGAGIAGGLAALGTGYSVAQSVGAHNNTLTTVLAAQGAGVASGALAGTMIMPGIGTAIGAVVGGISGLIGGLFGSAEAHRKAREEAQRLAEAQRVQAEAARVAAANAKGLADALNAAAEGDLRARDLRLAGMTDEAAAQELWNRQVKEFADAVRQGVSEEVLQHISRTQEAERSALAAQQAADAEQKLADARAEAAKRAEETAQRIADAWRMAADYTLKMADAAEELGVRLLRAQGNVSEADRKAFELQQARERHAIEAEIRQFQFDELKYAGKAERTTGGYVSGDYYYPTFNPNYDPAAEAQVAALRQMAAAARDYLSQLVSVQAAEKAQFLAQQGMPGATAKSATGGTFNTIVSRTTAVQGDRMVDELTTLRTLAMDYWPYLKDIAEQLRGGVNRMLGVDLTQTRALAGSALVT